MSKSLKIVIIVAIVAIAAGILIYMKGQSSYSGSYAPETAQNYPTNTNGANTSTKGSPTSAQPATPASGNADDIITDLKADASAEDSMAAEDDKDASSASADDATVNQFNAPSDENTY